MPEVQINLVVIRATDLDRSAQFYQCLGLRFTKHRHGKGPEHYASEGTSTTFEIYPQGPEGTSSAGLRLGFEVNSVDGAIEALAATGAVVVSLPQDSPWGRRAVIDDLDGYRVELTETLHSEKI